MLTGIEELRQRVDPMFYERHAQGIEEMRDHLAAMSPSDADNRCFSQFLEWTAVPLVMFSPRIRAAEYVDSELLFLVVMRFEALQDIWRTHSPSLQRRACAQLIIDLLLAATENRRKRWRDIEDHVFVAFLVTCLEWCPITTPFPDAPFDQFIDGLAETLTYAFMRRSSMFASLQGYSPDSVTTLLADVRRYFDLPTLPSASP